MSLLASPVVHVIYGVANRGPGNAGVNTMLWSQTFVVFTAVSLAWTIRDLANLRKMTSALSMAGGGVKGPDDEDVTVRETSAPEICIIQAAEYLLSARYPGSASDEDVLMRTMHRAVIDASLNRLPMDMPVLQTLPALQAWRQVIRHEMEVEVHIRETHQWGVLGEKLMSMNAGMSFMVGIVQV